MTSIDLKETYSSPSFDLKKPVIILKVISHIILIGICITIYISKSSTEKQKFQYIYYLSKILTIKNIILNNHYSEILNGFTNSGAQMTVPNTYRNLLKLVENKNECKTGYKPCGILDTYGNVLCIEEFFECPVNKAKADRISKESIYSSQNYKSVSLNEMSNGYKFFYSNQFNEGNVISIIIKTKDEPKYITNSNFILDSEAFKEVFGDKDLLDQIADAFGLKGDNKEKNDDDAVDKVIKIFQVTEEIVDEYSLVLKGAKLLYTVLNYEYNKNVEKFNEYVKEQIDILDEDNIDIFYEDIGDNMYAKNYIGFRSVEDIKKFLKFDYDIYKKKFPSFKGALAALIIGIIMILISLVMIIFLCVEEKDEKDIIVLVIIESIIHYGFALGYFIYALCIYFMVNKNKTLDELKAIKSDQFINGMIDDFVSECQKSTLVIISMSLLGLSIIINLVSMIFFYKLIKSM